MLVCTTGLAKSNWRTTIFLTNPSPSLLFFLTKVAIPAMGKDILTWCDELHPLKGNISQLQATLGLILARAPTVVEYNQLQRTIDGPSSDDHKLLEPKLRALVGLAQVRVAVRLRALYSRGNLPFLMTLMKINFKSNKADKFVGYLVDYKPQSTSEMLPDSVTKGVLKRKARDVADAVASYPPTLPVILSSGLRKRIFTHKSYRQISDFLEADSADQYALAHNSKLALQGRSLLDVALLQLLDKKFPTVQSEDLELMKYRLASTLVLTKMAMGYNLSQHMNHNISNQLSNEGKMEVLLTVFLAYLGALPLDGYSMNEVCLWIEKLYDPIVGDVQPEHTTTSRLLARSELGFLLGDKLRFENVESDPFVVKAFYKDTEIAVGTNSDQTTAMAVALEAALANKSLLDGLLRAQLELENGSSPEKLANSQKTPAEIRVNEEMEELALNSVLNPGLNQHIGNSISETGQATSPKDEKMEDVGDSPDLEAYSPLLESQENSKKNGLGTAQIPQVDLPPPIPSGKQNETTAVHLMTSMPQKPAHSTGLPTSLPAVPSNILRPAAATSSAGPVSAALTPNQSSTIQSSDATLENNLKTVLAAVNLVPEYHYEEIGAQFKVTITVNGLVLAQSQDSNKPRATRRAIRAGLAALTQMAPGIGAPVSTGT